MSGLDVTVTQADMNNTDGPQAVMKPTVEVVFDVQRPGDGGPLDPDEDAGRGARIARGLAAMQKAGIPVGKAPAAASKPPEEPSGEKKSDGGMEVTVVDPEKGDAGASEVIDRSEKPADGAEKPADEVTEAEKKEEPAVPPEVAKIREDLALAQARIDLLASGSIPDEERTAWIEKPVDWMRGALAKHMGVKPDSEAVTKALAHFQWELTVDSLGVENLPKDLRERNDTEHAKRRGELAEVTRSAQQAAKTAQEGRESDRLFIGKAYDAAPDKYPYAAAGAELMLGGMHGADAAVLLWTKAKEAGTIKDAGNAEANANEALRLYNEFCKTRLGTKLQLQNATPSPASTPAASKEAATGAKKATTVSQKQAASAPAAKQVTPAPTGPEVIDASDPDSRTRRVKAIASKHLAKS